MLLLAQVPDIWKRANVIHIHKKDDKIDVVNYRHISLMSSVGKALEKIVHTHVHDFVLEKKLKQKHTISVRFYTRRFNSKPTNLLVLYILSCPGRRQGSPCGILRHL